MSLESEREAQAKADNAFRDALSRAQWVYSETQLKGTKLEYFHAQAGQYGKENLVLMRHEDKYIWGNPAVDIEAMVVFTLAPHGLLQYTELIKPEQRRTFVMWKHTWEPTYRTKIGEHLIIWVGTPR